MRYCLVALLFAFGVFASTANAQVTITDGTSSYTWDPLNSSSNLTSTGVADSLFEDIWVVRFQDGQDLGGPTQVERLLSSADEFNVVNNGDNASITFGFGSIWDATPLFDFTIDIAVSTSPGGRPKVSFDFTAEYVNSGAFNDGAGSLSIFHYFDTAMDGFGGDDVSVVDLGGGQTAMNMSTPGGTSGQHIGYDVDSFEIQGWSGSPGANIKDRIDETYDLNNATTNLTNVDITGAFQWDFTVSTVGDTFTTSSVYAVPEPATAGIFGALALVGFAIRRRRRRR